MYLETTIKESELCCHKSNSLQSQAKVPTALVSLSERKGQQTAEKQPENYLKPAVIIDF